MSTRPTWVSIAHSIKLFNNFIFITIIVGMVYVFGYLLGGLKKRTRRKLLRSWYSQTRPNRCRLYFGYHNLKKLPVHRLLRRFFLYIYFLICCTADANFKIQIKNPFNFQLGLKSPRCTPLASMHIYLF